MIVKVREADMDGRERVGMRLIPSYVHNCSSTVREYFHICSTIMYVHTGKTLNTHASTSQSEVRDMSLIWSGNRDGEENDSRVA